MLCYPGCRLRFELRLPALSSNIGDVLANQENALIKQPPEESSWRIIQKARTRNGSELLKGRSRQTSMNPYILPSIDPGSSIARHELFVE